MTTPTGQELLSPQLLQNFTASLAGLPAEEVRGAKRLFVRNAISEYKNIRAQYKAFGGVQLVFAIIPFFWPILWVQRRSMSSNLMMYEERIENALAVWPEDLTEEARLFQEVRNAA